MSEIIRYRSSLSFVFLLTAFVPADLLTPTMLVQQYLIATSRYLLGHICAFLLYVGFTLFVVLLYIVISVHFPSYTSTF